MNHIDNKVENLANTVNIAINKASFEEKLIAGVAATAGVFGAGFGLAEYLHNRKQSKIDNVDFCIEAIKDLAAKKTTKNLVRQQLEARKHTKKEIALVFQQAKVFEAAQQERAAYIERVFLEKKEKGGKRKRGGGRNNTGEPGSSSGVFRELPKEIDKQKGLNLNPQNFVSVLPLSRDLQFFSEAFLNREVKNMSVNLNGQVKELPSEFLISANELILDSLFLEQNLDLL